MHRSVIAFVLAATLSLVLAPACAVSGSCNCPTLLQGPGWCPAQVVEGTGDTCVCATTTLCPGWCLPADDPNGAPFECSQDASMMDAAAPEAGPDASAETGAEAGPPSGAESGTETGEDAGGDH